MAPRALARTVWGVLPPAVGGSLAIQVLGAPPALAATSATSAAPGPSSCTLTEAQAPAGQWPQTTACFGACWSTCAARRVVSLGSWRGGVLGTGVGLGGPCESRTR